MNYVYGVVGGLILLLCGALAWRTHQYEKSQAQVGLLGLQLGHAVSANADQKKAIEILSRANAEFANTARLQISEYRELLAEHVRLRLKYREAEAARMIRERTDKATPACRRVLDLDLSESCPNISDAIRDRAR